MLFMLSSEPPDDEETDFPNSLSVFGKFTEIRHRRLYRLERSSIGLLPVFREINLW